MTGELEKLDIWQLINKTKPKASAEALRALYLSNHTLQEIAVDLHWMARRYADGRCTYAPGIVNNAVRTLGKMGINLNVCGEGTPWARDGMGPGYSGLSEDEYNQGEPVNDWNRIARDEETQALCKRILRLEKALLRAREHFAREMDQKSEPIREIDAALSLKKPEEKACT